MSERRDEVVAAAVHTAGLLEAKQTTELTGLPQGCNCL